MPVRVIPYTDERRPAWDEIVRNSPAATFLHLRGYMDYHRARFADRSVMVYNERGSLLAVMPACEGDQHTIVSHAGLTYGGLLTRRRGLTPETMLDVMRALLLYYHSEGYHRVEVRPAPYIYWREPSDDLTYAAFRLGAKMTRCHYSGTIDLSHGFRPCLSKHDKTPEIGEDSIASFWPILQQRLEERYNVLPAHTQTEMELLQSRFPSQIKVFTARIEGRIVAGTVIYNTGMTVHTQYMATTAEGRECEALPQLISYIAGLYSDTARYLDYGASTEDDGSILNEALAISKHKQGARAVCYCSWLWATSRF